MSNDSWENVTWTCLSGLSRRIGQRYGFASVRISPTDVALFGGVVHYDLTGKGRGNPIPFSHIHCIGSMQEESKDSAGFDCSLMTIAPTEALPCARLYHTATYVGEQQVIILGGQSFSDKRKLGDMWILTLKPNTPGEDVGRHLGEWIELAPSARSTAFPPPRAQHAATWLGKGPLLLVSGGSGFEDTVLGDMWTASIDDSSSVAWKRVNCAAQSPCARKGHALSPLVSECEIVLCGGVDAEGRTLGDIWIAQFLNDEKTRCVWTELVTSPNPRANGHIIFPSGNSMLIFGGGGPAEQYNLKTGKWTVNAFPTLDTAANFVAVEIDVVYDSIYPIPSVLLIGDSVTGPVSPWLASIYACEILDDQVKEEEKLVEPPNEAETKLRRDLYDKLAHDLPSLPGGTAIVKKKSEPQSNLTTTPMETIEYFATQFDKGQCCSWSGANPNTSHVMISASTSSFGTFAEFQNFVNDPKTLAHVAQTANSALLIARGADKDTWIGFLSEALLRHVSASTSPVVSLNTSAYAEVQATLRLLMIYTPFKSAFALTDLFELFHKQSGCLLIDFDAESVHKAPIVSLVGKTDSHSFWYEAIRHRPRGVALEQYAARYLHTTDFLINGQTPTISLFEALKTKLLEKPVHHEMPAIGKVLIGKIRNGADLGVLVYCKGKYVCNLLEDVDITVIVERDETESIDWTEFAKTCNDMILKYI